MTKTKENKLTRKITAFVESVMNEIERKSSEFDDKKAEIEQEMNRGATPTKIIKNRHCRANQQIARS